MMNSYEMPEVFDLGRAIEEILGSKPIAPEIEAIMGFGPTHRAVTRRY